MRMRKLNVPTTTREETISAPPKPPQPPHKPLSGWLPFKDQVYAREKAAEALAFEEAWLLVDNKENSASEWRNRGVGGSAPPRQHRSPVSGTVARPSSMPVPSARKRGSSPSYDPPCKKALGYDRAPLKGLASPPGPLTDSGDSDSSPGGSGSSPGGARPPRQLSPFSALLRRPLNGGGDSPSDSAVTPVRRRLIGRPSVARGLDPVLTADQKMQKALNIRPSLMKLKGRSMTDRLKSSKLLHDVVLPVGPTALLSAPTALLSTPTALLSAPTTLLSTPTALLSTPTALLTARDDDLYTDGDQASTNQRGFNPDSTSPTPSDPFHLVDNGGIMNGPFAAREETVSFLSSVHEMEETCEPQDIGFYNPGNLCWMNSVVQCVIGLAPLMGDIQEHMVDKTSDQPANKYSNVLRGLIKILSVRRQGIASRVNDALRKFHKSLEALKPQFATDTQQDCPEFLTELLDHLRDEFHRLSRSEGAKLREISDNAPGWSLVGGREGSEANPVRDNTEIAMRQQKTCVGCSEMVVGEIREPILIVDVPDMPKCSLQHALKGYFKSADIERQCDKCNAKTSRTTTAMSRLPRVLIVQLKRYICKERTPESTFSGIEKVNSRVRIPEWLSVQDITTDDVQLPSVRVSSAAPTPIPVYLDESSNQEDRELEEAKLRSMEASDDAEDEQLRQALAASMLDAPRSLPNSLTNTPVKDGGTPMKEDEPTHSRDYRLVAFIQHMGVNPNSGHYTSSVYNFPRGCWMNYNDADVERLSFESAVGDRAQKNGYIFFYLHRGQFEAQSAAEGGGGDAG